MSESASMPIQVSGERTVSLDESVRHCHRVTRERARNFYYGLKLTPEPRRSAGYAIYAFMRACDDLVDQEMDAASKSSPSAAGGSPATPFQPAPAPPANANASDPDAISVVIARPDNTPHPGLARIEQFRSQMEAVLASPDDRFTGPLANDPMWPAFRHAVKTYDIDKAHLHAMLDGQRADLVKKRYATFDELYDYCYKVASVVGLVCIRIWGAPTDPAVLKMAEHRGVALQLTNILRDLVEDAQRDRVYLPAEDLARYGYTVQDILARRGSDAFDRMMNFELRRAREYYQKSAALDAHLDPSCRPTSWALMAIYRALHEKIAHNPRRVLRTRVKISRIAKAGIALRATMKRKK